MNGFSKHEHVAAMFKRERGGDGTDLVIHFTVREDGARMFIKDADGKTSQVTISVAHQRELREVLDAIEAEQAILSYRNAELRAEAARA